MSAGYPDFSWSVRVVRTLVVVAVAVLAGAVIGGVCVYVIDDALTAPPQSQIRADASKDKEMTAANNPAPSSAQTVTEPKANAMNAQGQPMRTIDPSLPAPVAAPTPQASNPIAPATSVPSISPPPDTSSAQPQSAPPNVSQPAAPSNPQTGSNPQTASQTAPPAQAAQTSPQAAQTPWPDALSRAHPSTPDTQEAEKPVPAAPPTERTPNSGDAAAARAEPSSEDQSAQSAATRNETISTRKPGPAKKRVTVTRTAMPAATDNVSAAEPAKQRPVYDHYDKGDRDYDEAGDHNRQDGRQDMGPASDKARAAQPNRPEPRTRASKTKQRIIVREQDDSDQHDERADGRVVLPPQPRPAQSFLGGLFGGDRDDDSQ